MLYPGSAETHTSPGEKRLSRVPKHKEKYIFSREETLRRLFHLPYEEGSLYKEENNPDRDKFLF